MAIISVQFLLFLGTVFLLYFLLPLKLRPYVLLAASMYFYACFDWVGFLYLGTTTVTTFAAAQLAHRAKQAGNLRQARLWLGSAVVLNAGILILVKFLASTLALVGSLLQVTVPELRIPAALGIAFYTMQSISYCVDVYRGKYPPEKSFWKYLLYMSFFPIIMQGPISRYDQLAHQLVTPHRFSFDRMKAGCSLMLWGMFQKMVVADRAALLVNQVFGKYTEYAGFQILIAVFLYTIQLYADFSGCVDISRGVSQVLGIELERNFNAPYFADSIQDFWRRWHISLSSWFKDYIYIPLGGSRKGTLRKYGNLMAVFFVSGLWHGVGMHYMVWGAMQGIFQIVGAVTQKARFRLYDRLGINREGWLYRLGRWAVTFALVNLSWLVFRADGCTAALRMLWSALTVFNPQILTNGAVFAMGLDKKDFLVLAAGIVLLFAVNYLQQKGSVREKLERCPFWIRYPVYILAVLSVLVLGVYGPGFDQSQFLYMQF